MCIQAGYWWGSTESSLKNNTFWEVGLEPFFVLVSKGYFVTKHTKTLLAFPTSFI